MLFLSSATIFAQAPMLHVLVPKAPAGFATTWCYMQDKIWKRLRLKAKQTRHHSPAAWTPRKENWRKPSTSLMIPITGSTVHVRA